MNIGLFLLMSSMIGIGFLTIPGMIKTSGLVLSILIIVIAGVLNTFGNLLITRGKNNSIQSNPMH